MNHNSLVRFVVRLRTQKDTSKFLGTLPLVWSGGVRQLRSWAKEKGLQFCACQQEVLGGHYLDASTGYEYFLDLK
jgi:hypothetical protein